MKCKFCVKILETNVCCSKEKVEINIILGRGFSGPLSLYSFRNTKGKLFTPAGVDANGSEAVRSKSTENNSPTTLAASCSCRCIERFWIVKSRPIYSDNSQEWPKWMELPDKTSWWNPTRLPSSVWTGWPARGPACLSPDLCLWLYWSGRRHPPSCLSSHVSPSPLFLLSLTSPSSSCPSYPFPSIS